MSARRGVHDLSDEDVVSPIKSDKPRTTKSPGSLRNLKPRSSYCSFKNTIIISAILVPVIAILCIQSLTNNDFHTCEFDNNNNDTLWQALDSGIKDMKNFHKPSVFLLLYQKSSEQILEQILQNISYHVNCVLDKSTDNLDPIVLTAKQLHLPELMEDYGLLLDKYKAKLELKNLMIVRNLEEIPWSVARAFHSICDEYSPLVKDSVIVFTMKVTGFPEQELTFVENTLRDKWHRLNEDHFEPLFARISGMILKVNPGNKI